MGEEIAPKMVVPSKAQCEFIYANRCKLTGVNLGGIGCLLELSLLHNKIKDLSFLSFANCRLGKLFIDHNLLTTLECLPPTLTVLTAGFNQISDIDANSLELTRSPLK